MKIEQKSVYLGNYRDHVKDRRGYARTFADLVSADPNARGMVLDIGCGGKVDRWIEPFTRLSRELHGVDTTPEIVSHPQLQRYWHEPFETAAIPPATYDMAYGHYVAEHIRSAEPFLRKVYEVLRPGGSYWALTPNGTHPFAYISRTVELMGFKQRFADAVPGVNRYSSYYRLNRAGQIVPVAKAIGFGSASFYYMPCVDWDFYFPWPLRFLPRMFDAVAGVRFPKMMLMLAYQLVKPM
jgi:SAM-dependent methyltransferase